MRYGHGQTRSSLSRRGTAVRPMMRTSRFPADCLSAAVAVDCLGSARYGATWRTFCPLCLERAERRGVGVGGAWTSRYGFALVAAPPLAGAAWTMVSSHAKLAGERYLTARLTVALLLAACAALSAAYGLAGIARRRGWFHRHPPADGETAERWRATVDQIADAVESGRLQAYALSLDGKRTAIGRDGLPRPTLVDALAGADANASWAAVAKALRLRNAPSGAVVLGRAGIDRLCAACEPS